MTRNFQLSQAISQKIIRKKKKKQKSDEKFSTVSVRFAKITRKKKKEEKKDSDEKVWQLLDSGNQTWLVNLFLSLFTTIPREIVGK